MLPVYILLATIAFFAAFNIGKWCQDRKKTTCTMNASVATWFTGVVLCVLAVFGTMALIR